MKLLTAAFGRGGLPARALLPPLLKGVGQMSLLRTHYAEKTPKFDLEC